MRKLDLWYVLFLFDDRVLLCMLNFMLSESDNNEFMMGSSGLSNLVAHG